MNKLNIIMVLITLVGCGSEESNPQEDEFILSHDVEEFGKRFVATSKKLQLVTPDLNLQSETVQADFELTLVGELAPPSIDGSLLQATDVYVAGNKAIVSYNTAGEVKNGAVDLIDVKDPQAPALISQIILPRRDVNAIHFSSNNFYFTGSWEKDLLSYLTRVQVKSGDFTLEYDDIGLTGYAGTDVNGKGDSILVSTGDNSGLHKLDHNSFVVEQFIDLADARSVGVKGNETYVLTGQPGSLTEIDKKGEIDRSIAIGGASIPESKSTLVVGNGAALTAVGDGGTVITCLKDGKPILTIPAPKSEGDQVVSNAAMSHGGHLFVANGEAGVYAYRLKNTSSKDSKCGGVTAEFVGKIDFGDKLSANHVDFNGRFLFVADGLGGLKVVYFKRTSEKDDDDYKDCDSDENEDFDND